MASIYTFSIPKEYGYVLVTAASTFFLGVWHGGRVTGYRKNAKVPYPNQYAVTSGDPDSKDPKDVDGYLFNCAQRAHYNYLENHPSVVLSMLIAGLRYPVASSVMGVVWMIFRVVYAVGYTRKDKTNGKGRLAGVGFWLPQAGLFGTVGWVGVSMLRE
ncbi:MAG: hypothetical protein M1831_002209 [Alyxoria varia]|nr:MAG: hypothetical protein M1831_002209 [Alyxoria varia]